MHRHLQERDLTICEMQVLSCLKFLQQPGSKTTRQRWRSASSDLQPGLETQTSAGNPTWAAAAQPSADHAAASDGLQVESEPANGAGGEAGCKVSARDTVLVFAVHRFDR